MSYSPDTRQLSRLKAILFLLCLLPTGMVSLGSIVMAASYPVLTGDYASEQARWASRPIVAGTPLAKPTPLFRKLDDSLGETGPDWAPIG